MPGPFILIAGRTSTQGCGISQGKFTDGYVQETSVLQVSPEDLHTLGVGPGDRVRVASAFGHVDVEVLAARKGELPPGVVFIAYGDRSSRLMGPDSHATGMPTSKGIDVTLEKIT
jgi:formylmethanofuran dehydrogenase subunit D